jgi:hypothetical protein
MRKIFSKQTRMGTVGLLIAIFAAFFLLVPVAYAALYNISTTDNTVSDWNPVPVFQTDPTGDCVNSCTPGQDIVEAKAASMDTTGNGVGDFVHFMVKTASDAGLGERGRVAASIDCDNDGTFEEFDDRLVLFDPGDGAVRILHGTRLGQAVLIPPDLKQGQKVDQYYEWGISIDDLYPFPDDTPGLPDDYCQGTVGVRFQTFRAGFPTSGGGFEPPLIYDTTEAGPYAMINLPTAVSVSNFGAAGASVNSVAFVALAGLIIIGGLSGIILLRRRQ